MMNYKEYYESVYNYRQAVSKLHKIQNKLSDIINSMLSTTAQMKDNLGSSRASSNDKMLSLTAKKIELEAQEELRKSKDTKDKVYIMFFIDHSTVSEIALVLNYGKSYIYDVLSEIKRTLNELEKSYKSGKNQ